MATIPAYKDPEYRYIRYPKVIPGVYQLHKSGETLRRIDPNTGVIKNSGLTVHTFQRSGDKYFRLQGSKPRGHVVLVPLDKLYEKTFVEDGYDKNGPMRIAKRLQDEETIKEYRSKNYLEWIRKQDGKPTRQPPGIPGHLNDDDGSYVEIFAAEEEEGSL